MQLACGQLDRFDRFLAARGKTARGVSSLLVPKGGGWQVSVTFPPSRYVPLFSHLSSAEMGSPFSFLCERGLGIRLRGRHNASRYDGIRPFQASD